jgi:hypothetical protein
VRSDELWEKRTSQAVCLPHSIAQNAIEWGAGDWSWSSFRHYLKGEACAVEIESRWTARARERLGPLPTAQAAKKTPAQAELGRGTFEGREGV